MDVLGLIVHTVSVKVKQHLKKKEKRLSSELESSVKVEVDVLGSPSLIIRTVSVDGKQHLKRKIKGCLQSWKAV